MTLRFVWDENKARSNLQKHGVSFEEAQSIFGDPFSLTIVDEKHSMEEERFIDLGISNRNRLLVVVYSEQEATIRIISSREATSQERRHDEERAT
jgi:hypothetical protein